MQVNELVQLAETGNTRTVEQEWMSTVEDTSATPETIVALAPVLAALAARDNVAEAESLAWAAVETLSERQSPADALRVAKPFLLTLNRSNELRSQVAGLYRTVYADRPGIEALVDASGIGGGRPPRRAMRTLDVCLAVAPGSFAAARHDESVVRIETVDPTTWAVRVDGAAGPRTLEPMAFADTYAPCDADDIRVLLHYDLDRLRTLMVEEPAAVIVNILKTKTEAIDSDDLRRLLVPRVIAADNWSKWWTKARAAIRKSPHVHIEGRSPYRLRYDPDKTDYARQFEASFSRLGTPEEQLAALQDYLRECKGREEPPDTGMLARLREQVARRAERLESTRATAALAERLLEWQIGLAAGDQTADQRAIDLLARSPDVRAAIRTCQSPALWRCAVDCLQKALPDRWPEVVQAVFPFAPAGICDELAARLPASVGPDRTGPIVDAILSEPLACFEALCWLWDKGLSSDRWRTSAPVTILTRLLRLLGRVKRDDSVPPEMRRRIYAMTRSALSARSYERFDDCLSRIERGMAAALRTDITRLDNLGRNVREDLLSRIRRRFPELYAKAATPVWAMEDVIFATEDGMSRWERAIAELVNVKMKENAKAIGAAAEKGDLSENSEYKFALEERDLLRARLAHMQSQFAMARPIQPDQVTNEYITVGSKVTFRHCETGAEFVMTFLGPFEADAERHIYNYKAPLAQELMGARIGEQVELAVADPKGLYEVVALSAWR